MKVSESRGNIFTTMPMWTGSAEEVIRLCAVGSFLSACDHEATRRRRVSWLMRGKARLLKLAARLSKRMRLELIDFRGAGVRDCVLIAEGGIWFELCFHPSAPQIGKD